MTLAYAPPCRTIRASTEYPSRLAGKRFSSSRVSAAITCIGGSPACARLQGCISRPRQKACRMKGMCVCACVCVCVCRSQLFIMNIFNALVKSNDVCSMLTSSIICILCITPPLMGWDAVLSRCHSTELSSAITPRGGGGLSAAGGQHSEDAPFPIDRWSQGR